MQNSSEVTTTTKLRSALEKKNPRLYYQLNLNQVFEEIDSHSAENVKQDPKPELYSICLVGEELQQLNIEEKLGHPPNHKVLIQELRDCCIAKNNTPIAYTNFAETLNKEKFSEDKIHILFFKVKSENAPSEYNYQIVKIVLIKKDIEQFDFYGLKNDQFYLTTTYTKEKFQLISQEKKKTDIEQKLALIKTLNIYLHPTAAKLYLSFKKYPPNPQENESLCNFEARYSRTAYPLLWEEIDNYLKLVRSSKEIPDPSEINITATFNTLKEVFSNKEFFTQLKDRYENIKFSIHKISHTPLFEATSGFLSAMSLDSERLLKIDEEIAKESLNCLSNLINSNTLEEAFNQAKLIFNNASELYYCFRINTTLGEILSMVEDKRSHEQHNKNLVKQLNLFHRKLKNLKVYYLEQNHYNQRVNSQLMFEISEKIKNVMEIFCSTTSSLSDSEFMKRVNDFKLFCNEKLIAEKPEHRILGALLWSLATILLNIAGFLLGYIIYESYFAPSPTKKMLLKANRAITTAEKIYNFWNNKLPESGLGSQSDYTKSAQPSPNASSISYGHS